MSRSERKRRYRARRRRRFVTLTMPPGVTMSDEVRRAVVEMERLAFASSGVPATLLEGKPAVGLDFGYPNASVVVADRTPAGNWIIRAD